MRAHVHKKNYTGMFIAALFVVAYYGEQPECPPTDKWVEDGYPHNEKLSGNIKLCIDAHDNIGEYQSNYAK